MGQRPKISLRRSRHTVSVRPMSPLEYPDRHHLNAAAGWLELGDLVEAGRELSRLSETGGNHPEALTLSWHLLADDGNWTDALEIARQHLRAAPKSPEAWIHQSFALHELQRTNEAATAAVWAGWMTPDSGCAAPSKFRGKRKPSRPPWTIPISQPCAGSWLICDQGLFPLQSRSLLEISGPPKNGSSDFLMGDWAAE
jgi:hypothetical protein